MTRLLQILYGFPKKSSRNLAVFDRTHEETRVSSTIIKLGDTFVSDSSFGFKVEWLVKN